MKANESDTEIRLHSGKVTSIYPIRVSRDN